MKNLICEEEILKQAVKIGVAIGAVIFGFIVGIVGAWFASKQMGDDEWKIYYKNNFPFVAALPMAVVAAFGITVYFDVATGGSIEGSFLGLEFKGPAGPLMLWILVFISIIFAIKILARK